MGFGQDSVVGQLFGIEFETIFGTVGERELDAVSEVSGD